MVPLKPITCRLDFRTLHPDPMSAHMNLATSELGDSVRNPAACASSRAQLPFCQDARQPMSAGIQGSGCTEILAAASLGNNP